MESIHASNRISPCISGPNPRKPQFLPHYPFLVCFNHKLPVTNSLKLIASSSPCRQRFAPLSNHNRYVSVSKCRRGNTLCRLEGEDKPAGGNEDSPWKAIEKAVGNFGKQQSIEDVLRKQMEKQEYASEGGGKNPPGGGGGGGGEDEFGGSEDESLSGILDETLQMVLATIGFIFLYVYILTGEEIARLAKDYLKYLFGGNKSVRLRRAMYQWRAFFAKLTEKKEYDQFWLEKAIITTPTWYDSPDKYREILNSYIEYEEDDDDNRNDYDDDANGSYYDE
ncbi:Tetratricopeptide repeat-like superfamily protein [Hibiscus syriacus]|uniref:Tetratricopeptide repeat-like superfamily protein n=1 Tax=Hibiscus syriacus TaxID=106335 RepID=A0A6A3BWH8_HIBSY|nr:uncharacterized protein LOC120209965 [Hibiscus syriacus]KAE8720251.1 Tetratricopeptide repeat-like superfamily protein [Hibiscus syriacus]